MKRFILCTGIVCLSFVHIAQKNVFVNISPKVEGNPLQLGTTLTDVNGNAFDVTAFDYYLSNITLIHDGGQVMVLTPEVYLIEPENHTIYLGYLDLNVVEEIQFGIGVPFNLNTISGEDAIDISAYPIGHPLSFQNPSMHWGWSSGYFCMIVSGNADSNSDDTPDALFEVHSLGKENYTNVVLPVIGTDIYTDQLDININCNVDVWLTGVNLGSVGILHGTEGLNALVMSNAADLDVFNQDVTAAINTNEKIPGKLWFHNSSSLFIAQWDGIKHVASINIVDVQGRIVAEKSINSISGKTEFSDLPSGTYRVSVYDTENNLLKTINAVR
jgi:hypothetical protein